MKDGDSGAYTGGGGRVRGNVMSTVPPQQSHTSHGESKGRARSVGQGGREEVHGEFREVLEARHEQSHSAVATWSVCFRLREKCAQNLMGRESISAVWGGGRGGQKGEQGPSCDVTSLQVHKASYSGGSFLSGAPLIPFMLVFRWFSPRREPLHD